MQDASATAASECLPSAEKPSLVEVVERIGIGPAHLRFCLTGGGVYLADGAELLLITAVTTAVANDWGLNSFRRGMAVTIVFVGVLLGNLICGPMGDRYGRRQLIISSYIGIFIFSVLSSFSTGYNTFCLLRLLVGFSFGIGQPAWNALCTEVTPRFWRIAMNGASQTLFVAGEIYSASLILSDDPDLKHLHWRRLLQLGAIPSALFAFASAIFLLPSPSFLALHGQAAEAKKVLEVMKQDNGIDANVSTDFHHLPDVRLSGRQFGYQLKEIFNRQLFSTTLVISFTCFGLNVVYYGCLYAFPQILPDLQGGGSAGVQLLMGALCEIPGNGVAIVLGMCMPRKPVMKLYLLLMATCLFMFIGGVESSASVIGPIMYHGGYYGIKAVACIGYIITYQYAAEVYPTETRATGAAFCIGSGRLGAMIAPLIFEGLQDVFHSYASFFYLLCLVCVVNGLLIDLLPFETADRVLMDRLLPTDEPEGTDTYGTATEARQPDLECATQPAKDQDQLLQVQALWQTLPAATAATAPTALSATAPQALSATAPVALSATAPVALSATAPAALAATAPAALAAMATVPSPSVDAKEGSASAAVPTVAREDDDKVNPDLDDGCTFHC